MVFIDNHEVYSTVEFDAWAFRKDLLPEEKYLIETYFKKDKKTLEAGTAGGRILLEMKDLGFQDLHGYDYVGEFIEQAKQKDTSHSICFEVQDATNLNYKDSSFDQLIYLQQIMSSIEGNAERLAALKEAHRILKPGGIILFSFLSYEVRIKSSLYLPYLVYLRVLRRLTGSKRSMQELPWLKLGGKLNFPALLDRKPYVYWYKVEEVHQILKEMGFETIALGSGYQIKQGRMCPAPELLVGEPLMGMLYFVCTK